MAWARVVVALGRADELLRRRRAGPRRTWPKLAVRGSNRAGLGLGGSARGAESNWVLGRAREGSERAAQRQKRLRSPAITRPVVAGVDPGH